MNASVVASSPPPPPPLTPTTTVASPALSIQSSGSYNKHTGLYIRIVLAAQKFEDFLY